MMAKHKGDQHDREQERSVALDTLEEICKDKDVPPATRVEAARSVIEYLKWERTWVGKNQ